MCFYFILFFQVCLYVFMYAFYIKGNCGFVKSKTFISMAFYKTCPWSTDADAFISSTAIFVAIAIVWVKIIHFYFMPKIIWMLSKDCVP